MINKHTNKKYKFVKGKTYTAKGRANYRIKDYFDVIKLILVIFIIIKIIIITL